MAGETLEGVNPTRMELLSVRKKRILAEKGHKLLGEKRDALIVQFFDVLEKRDRLKTEVQSSLKDAGDTLDIATVIMGRSSVEAYAHGMPPAKAPEVSTLNIMGVRVPVMDVEVEDMKGQLPWGLGSTPQALDETARRYRMALERLMRLAEAEGSMERLALEIERTKRRVNALEHIFIPRLRNTEKYITMQLQEREREDFFRRKRIKAIMEGKARTDRSSPPEA